MEVLTPKSTQLKNTSNTHIEYLKKDGFVVTPNQFFQKGLEQFKKDLGRLLLLNNIKITPEALAAGLSVLENDPQFKLFLECYNQSLLSFFCDVINASTVDKGFMVTGQDYKANFDTETLSLTVENNFLLLGRPGSDEHYFIPGNIKINFKLGERGIELAEIKFSNPVLQKLILNNISNISSDLTFEAKLQEKPEGLYQSYRALILFLNKPTVDYHAFGGLKFLQQTVDDIHWFIKVNPEFAKKLSADLEFEAALIQLDPKKLLTKEIETITNPKLRNLHLALLQGFMTRGIKIDGSTLTQVREFVSGLNQQKDLNYNTYIKLAPPFLKLDKENFPNLNQASPAKRKPLGDITNTVTTRKALAF